jgi:hypothetical protein
MLKQTDISAEVFEKALRVAVASAAMTGHPLSSDEIVETAVKLYAGFLGGMVEAGNLRFDDTDMIAD